MPNWIITPSLRDHMITNTRGLVNRRIVPHQHDFPLREIKEIQNLIITPRQSELLNSLAKEGIHGGIKGGMFTGAVVHAKRPARLVFVAYNHESFYITPHYETGYRDNTTAIYGDAVGPTNIAHPPLLLPGLFTETQHAEIIDWTDRAVADARLRYSVNYTIAEFLNLASTTSLAHLKARWPFMRGLINDDRWLQRWDQLPRNLKRYAWAGSNWPRDNAKRIKLVELVLAEAMILPDPAPSTHPVRVMVLGWMPLPGEKF